MIPPASTRMHQAAATSHAQHPHSQNASCCPAATLHIAMAADPVHRSELTKRPPVFFCRGPSERSEDLQVELEVRSLPVASPFNADAGRPQPTQRCRGKRKPLRFALWPYGESSITSHGAPELSRKGL